MVGAADSVLIREVSFLRNVLYGEVPLCLCLNPELLKWNGDYVLLCKLTGSEKMATSVAPEIEVRERKNGAERKVRV